MISSVGNGMIITALPLLALRLRGQIPGGAAIALVEAAPYVLASVLALTLGLSRLRLPPRALLIGDSLLRGVVFVLVGVLAVSGALTLWMLAVLLLVGSVFQIAAMSGRRLVATGMTEPPGQLAVNGLLGICGSLAAYTIGPLVGGVVSAAASPGDALIVDGLTFFVMLAGACLAAPVRARPAGETGPESGLRILRRIPAARLLTVVFFFNFFYRWRWRYRCWSEDRCTATPPDWASSGQGSAPGHCSAAWTRCCCAVSGVSSC
jgi:MFS family permease